MAAQAGRWDSGFNADRSGVEAVAAPVGGASTQPQPKLGLLGWFFVLSRGCFLCWQPLSRHINHPSIFTFHQSFLLPDCFFSRQKHIHLENKNKKHQLGLSHEGWRPVNKFQFAEYLKKMFQNRWKKCFKLQSPKEISFAHKKNIDDIAHKNGKSPLPPLIQNDHH